jgi:hypothetical protein
MAPIATGQKATLEVLLRLWPTLYFLLHEIIVFEYFELFPLVWNENLTNYLDPTPIQSFP